MWRCRCLKEKTKELDKDLAEVDSSRLANSMRIGVAPAMVGDTRLTYWGTKPDENWSKETKKMMGCYARKPDEAIKEMMEKMGEGMTARRVMLNLIAAPEKEETVGGPKSEKVRGTKKEEEDRKKKKEEQKGKARRRK